MANFIRFVQTLDYMRMVVGICIVVNGYPLIFFFRETMKLAPGSTVFTAVVLAGGLVLMIPFTVLRRLYRPNMTMLWMGVSFLLLIIFYMFFFNGVPGFEDSGRDMIYFAYVLIFLFLLINIPNDIIRVFIPIVVLFTLVSNLGLIYALITDPTWAIGQRATITLNNGDEGSGNPHAFSRNAFIGVVACAIGLFRPQTNIFFKLLCFFAGLVNIAVLVLTQTRSAIVALILAVILFMYFNVRPAQIRIAVRGLVKPVPIFIMAVGFLGVIYFFQRYFTAYLILYDYVTSFMTRNLENVYALLGMKAQGVDYNAVLDDSAANRSVSGIFLRNVLYGHLHMLILGYGYKYLYLDVPLMEAFTNHGILGLVLFGGINALAFYHAIRTMRTNPNDLSTFLAYFYLLIFVQLFTNGRPNEISFWFPLSLMIRFIGVDHLFPAYLSTASPSQNTGQLVVVPTQPV
ncbi:O-antigen ligase family protein [Spirosoma pollinicola]|uniref:Uncharacterized protein n=1 Tax=Spirosoma pollinicola TaxID=2057025 RepID=A0A2K8Z282_9BACT|nr:hypothetical protein [Spirosoma pollinicola]AUD03951.1 hypothetical protein CWM47_20275 [Spirosoma pollinicola]